MKPSQRNTDPNRQPRKLNIEKMWELYRVLKPAGSPRVLSIIENVHPLQIAVAIEILYGSAQVVTNGILLLHYLYKGLEHNHFAEFVTATQRSK